MPYNVIQGIYKRVQIAKYYYRMIFTFALSVAENSN
jgi:hypothetical protein